MNKLRTREARIILGAAVIDDVLGLIVLAIISGLIIGVNTTGESVPQPSPLSGWSRRLSSSWPARSHSESFLFRVSCASGES